MGRINKSTISIEEYDKYREEGIKRPFYQGKIVKVDIICTNCQKHHLSPFCNIEKKTYKDLCTRCASSINTSLRNKKEIENVNSFRNSQIYRDKISVGVKRHYKENKDAVSIRAKKRIQTIIDRGGVSYSAKKSIVNGITCESFGEEVFVKMMIAKNYSIQRALPILYYCDEKNIQRVYTPDFQIEKGGVIEIVEVKVEYLANFNSKFQQNIKNLATYNLESVKRKAKIAIGWCKSQGFTFKIVTLDDKEFNLYYNRAKRLRQKNRKNENN